MPKDVDPQYATPASRSPYPESGPGSVAHFGSRLLAFLMHHAGRVVPATELADHLYDAGNDRDPNAIEVIIARLRRKIGNDAIETRRGFGYLVPDGSL